MSLPDDGQRCALRDLAVQAAEAGAAAALPWFRRPGLAVETKDDASPVTIADRASEAAIRAVLAAARPSDGWLGEETGCDRPEASVRWIVDPIDGTRNFVAGIPLWAVLVACEVVTGDHRQIVAAAALLPGLGERYDAVLGGGARCNGQAIAVSTVDRLAASLWCFETPYWYERAGLGGLFQQLCRETRLQRGISDACAHLLVASGRAELVIEPELSLWDMAAPSLIVTEAGGSFSSLTGEAGPYGAGCVVSNGRVHAEALTALHASRV